MRVIFPQNPYLVGNALDSGTMCNNFAVHEFPMKITTAKILDLYDANDTLGAKLAFSKSLDFT